MQKKKIVIVTGNENVASSIENDVRLVFGNSVEMIKLFPVQIEKMDRVEGDLFLLTRWDNIGNLADKVADKGRMLRVSRTIWESALKQILSIPPQSRVLVVNDSLKSSMHMRELLMDLHVDGLTYVPYYPGLYDPTLTVAITPGESAYVPSYIEKIIDVGNRHLDVTTFLDICNILQVNTPEISKSLLQYMSLVVDLGNINKQYRDILANTMRMESILRHMEQGLLLTLANGEIVMANAKIEQITGCSITAGKTQLCDVFAEPVARQLAQLHCDTQTMNICGREIIVKHDTIHFSTNIYQNLYFFSDITYLHSLEQSVFTRSKEKGFVAKYTFDDIVHQSAAMDECIRRFRIFSESDKTILIQGESGTGKELIAQSIHNSSNRRNRPFVAVNCAALPESLLESELFGYEKGAFTGAKQGGKMGLFEQANGGTIFLDEIGDVPFALQSRLLRVLQEKQVMRVGGDYIVNIDVRVIAATNQNLLEKLEAGTFRHDLYYRLNVLSGCVAPLRERREDILPLFLHFASMPSIPQDLAAILTSYDWPGNIRELQNAADYYMLMRDFENPLPEHIMKNAPRRNTAQWDLDHAILSLLRDGPLGRAALMQKLKAQERDISEYALRRRLEQLEQTGLLVKQLGCNGTAITENGLRSLQQARAT